MDAIAQRSGVSKATIYKQRIFFGRYLVEQATAEYEQRIAGWEAWRAVSAAHGSPEA